MIAGYLYPPTWLHRIPARLKLLILFGVATVLLVQQDWRIFVAGLAIVVVVYAALGRQALARLALLRTLTPLLALIYVLQWYTAGHAAAAASAARLLLMIMLADLVTMTTPMQAMLDAITPLFRPLERFGIRADKIALAVALVIRFVPLLFDLWRRRQEAWRARTVRRAPLQLVRLFLLDTLQMSGHVAEALEARRIDRQAVQGDVTRQQER